MAKKSMKERELKRQKTVARFAAKRAELKATIANSNATDEEVWDARFSQPDGVQAMEFDDVQSQPEEGEEDGRLSVGRRAWVPAAP